MFCYLLFFIFPSILCKIGNVSQNIYGQPGAFMVQLFCAFSVCFIWKYKFGDLICYIWTQRKCASHRVSCNMHVLHISFTRSTFILKLEVKITFQIIYTKNIFFFFDRILFSKYIRGLISFLFTTHFTRRESGNIFIL